MTMTRAELLERIEKGEKELDRKDLTDEQRKKYEARYCELVIQLSALGEEEPTDEEPEFEPVPDTDKPILSDDPSTPWRESIWAILKPTSSNGA